MPSGTRRRACVNRRPERSHRCRRVRHSTSRAGHDIGLSPCRNSWRSGLHSSRSGRDTNVPLGPMPRRLRPSSRNLPSAVTRHSAIQPASSRRISERSRAPLTWATHRRTTKVPTAPTKIGIKKAIGDPSGSRQICSSLAHHSPGGFGSHSPLQSANGRLMQEMALCGRHHRHLRITCITLKRGLPHIGMSGSSTVPIAERSAEHAAAAQRRL
jgi:hypothetical protein